MTASRPLSRLEGPTGGIEYLDVGTGAPGTVFAHGLAGSIATTRPFGTGVPGRRTFLHFRGHGGSDAPDGPWTYDALAEELRAVADHVGATRALGVSLGAGALLALAARTPDRFERLVLVLPAIIDEPREPAALAHFTTLADLVDEQDQDGIAAYFLDEQPADVRESPAVRTWAADQARVLSGTAVARALRLLPHEVPLADRSILAQVDAPVLIIGQEDDATHPVWAARELADALPRAEVEILPPGGVLWGHRARVRELVAPFLSAPSPARTGG
ncbi:MAG: alpha/beta hydrolase [Mobilicoccus sp.]|nr:alpha/beta hydrolase [Mobilicoccus sp.]